MSGIKYRRSQNIAFVNSPDEGRVVIMPLSGPQPYVLSGSAALIWSLVDGARDTSAIIDEICIRFPEAESEIHEIAEEFLGQLQGLRLLDPVE